MKRAPLEVSDVRHLKLCYSKDRYCGHPRQCGIYNFGSGEIAVLHHHADCSYENREDVRHGWDSRGYKSRCKILLQRSLDHGATWEKENEVVVWDYDRPLEAHRKVLWKCDDPGEVREEIDLISADSAIYFGRPMTGRENEDGEPTMECLAWRSGDRGRTWETSPASRINPPLGYSYVHADCYPVARFEDGTVLVPATADNRNTGGSVPRSQLERLDQSVTVLYGSDDNGLTWHYVSEVMRDTTGHGRPVYANLLVLPSGRLQCYALNNGGVRTALHLNHSDDGGYTWSEPQSIVGWGQSPWTKLSRDPIWSGARSGPRYRSCWPLLLRDGRIAVLFDRRQLPGGIGVIVSEDQGDTWSAEAVIRGDASDWDLGYVVGTELDDGRIFAAYYFMEEDGNNFGGTRHMAASSFILK